MTPAPCEDGIATMAGTVQRWAAKAVETVEVRRRASPAAPARFGCT